MEVNKKENTKKFIEETHDTGVIYLLTNTVTGKQYVGQAQSYITNKGKVIRHGIEGRFITHCKNAKKDKDLECCPKLYASMRKHGDDKFTKTLLVVVPIDLLNDTETEYILKYDTVKNGYNITKGGYSRTDVDKNKTRIERISQSMVQRWKDPEYIAKTTTANLEAVLKRANSGSTRKSNVDLPANIYKTEKGYDIRVMRDGKYKITSVESSDLSDDEKLTKAIERRDEILHNIEHNIDDSLKKKLDHNGCELPKGILLVNISGFPGYRAKFEYNGKIISKAFTSGKLTMDKKLELAKDALVEMSQNKDKPIVKLDHNNEHLPSGIRKVIKKEKHVGYLAIKNKVRTSFCSQTDSMDKKLELAKYHLVD